MRYAITLAAAVLLAPAVVHAADPPVITFQTYPGQRVLNDVRVATNLLGGEKATKAFNEGIKEKLGEKGFEGLDLSKAVVGYINLMPKPEETSVVVVFPVTGEKEFVDFCDRWNGHAVTKELEKGLWELPPLSPRYKARMKFSEGYAYIASAESEKVAVAALDAKALVPPNKLYDVTANAMFAGKFHFDRLTAEQKKALPTYLKNFKEELGLDDEELKAGWFGEFIVKPVLPEIEKLIGRYTLLLGGAENATLRVNVDLPASDFVVDFTLKPKADSALAKLISDFKPASNKFAGLLTADTAAGFKARLPFFNDELKAAGAKSMEGAQKILQMEPGAPKDMLDELFKGLIRTVKTGEMDIVGGIRGPDKNGDFTLVGAIAFEDPAALEKEFKKFVENTAPKEEQANFKWDAAKADKVSIHTYKFPADDFIKPGKIFGGDFTLAFAFAPKGVFIVLGPDAITTMKDALTVKVEESPMLDVVINPDRTVKLMKKANEREGGIVEEMLGKQDKLISAMSLKVDGGKELKVRYAVNLRLLPRALFTARLEERAEPVPPPPIQRK